MKLKKALKYTGMLTGVSFIPTVALATVGLSITILEEAAGHITGKKSTAISDKIAGAGTYCLEKLTVDDDGL